MNKLLQVFKSIFEKIKGLSAVRKIILAFMFSGLVVSLILFGVYSNSNKYGLLYSNLPAEDSKAVTDALKAQKVAYQIRGNSIYVAKEQVDALKIDLAPSLSDNTKGYDLFDTTNQFGMTDQEFKIKKIRAIQGELEKTIKSIPQIENARVLLTIPDESVFVADKEKGKASVYVQLKTGMKINAQQVKAIIAFVAGSVQEIPRENVEIIDDKLNLLSSGIEFKNDDNTTVQNFQTQMEQKSDFETKLQKNIIDLLAPVYGSGKVVAKVSADMDFDASEKTQISYDPKSVIVSSHIIKQSNSGSLTDDTSQSPLDNNSSNTITAATPQPTATPAPGTTPIPTGLTSIDSTINNDVGSTTTKSISAPGKITRITASVMIDGNPLDQATMLQLTNQIAGVIGYNTTRGDSINVQGLVFDPAGKKQMQDEMNTLKTQTAKDKQLQLYKTIAGYVVAFIIFLIVISRIFKKQKTEEPVIGESLDVLLGENVVPRDIMEFSEEEMESNNERSNIQNQVRKYATEKPELVADIVRTWLTEKEG